MTSPIDKGTFLRFHVADDSLEGIEQYLVQEKGLELVRLYQKVMILETRLPLDDLLGPRDSADERKKTVKYRLLTEKILDIRLRVEHANGQLSFDFLYGPEAEERKKIILVQLLDNPPTEEEIERLKGYWDDIIPNWESNLEPFIKYQCEPGIKLVHEEGLQIGTYEIQLQGNTQGMVPDVREGSDEMSLQMRDCSLNAILSLNDGSTHEELGKDFLEKFYSLTRDLQKEYNLRAKVVFGGLTPRS